MIQFASTSFIAATALIALPMILHLIRHEPSVPSDFPSFKFLYATRASKQNRNKILKWILLILRCALLTLAAFAFAWPFITDLAPKVEKATVLLWDNSYSIHATPWKEELRSSANTIIESASPTTPLLISCVSQTAVFSGEFTSDRATLQNWFKQNSNQIYTSSFNSVLTQAQMRLNNIRATQKEIILITDRQQLPWSNFDFRQPLANGLNLKVITPKQNKFTNCAIQKISTATTYTGSHEPVTLDIISHNYSASHIHAKLIITAQNYNEQQIPITIKAQNDTITQVTLSPKRNEQSDSPLFVKAQLICDDQLKVDNTRFFTTSINENKRVNITPALKTNYIAMALMPELTEKEIAKFITDPDHDNIANSSLLIIQDPQQFSPALDNKIIHHLKGGGNVILPVNASPACKRLLNSLNIKLGATHNTQSYLKYIDFTHQLFAPYKDVKINEWFSLKFYQWHELALPSTASVIARFNNDQPAIAQTRVHNGKVFLLAFNIDNKATNWVTSATFLPFWQELVTFLQTEKNERKTNISATCTPMSIPAGSTVFTDKAKNAMIDNAFTPNIPGNYYIHHNEQVLPFSVNPYTAESSTLMLASNFNSQIAKLNINANKPIINPTTSNAEIAAQSITSGRKTWWRELLTAAFIILFIELILSNRVAL